MVLGADPGYSTYSDPVPDPVLLDPDSESRHLRHRDVADVAIEAAASFGAYPYQIAACVAAGIAGSAVFHFGSILALLYQLRFRGS